MLLQALATDRRFASYPSPICLSIPVRYFTIVCGKRVGGTDRRGLVIFQVGVGP